MQVPGVDARIELCVGQIRVLTVQALPVGAHLDGIRGVGIAQALVAAVVILGAIALGLKFFNTSVREGEDQKGWDE